MVVSLNPLHNYYRIHETRNGMEKSAVKKDILEFFLKLIPNMCQVDFGPPLHWKI